MSELATNVICGDSPHQDTSPCDGNSEETAVESCRSMTLPRLLFSGLIRRDSSEDNERLACAVPRDSMSAQLCACLFTTNKLFNIKRHMERKHREVWNHFLANGGANIKQQSTQHSHTTSMLLAAKFIAPEQSPQSMELTWLKNRSSKSMHSNYNRRKRPHGNPPVRIAPSVKSQDAHCIIDKLIKQDEVKIESQPLSEMDNDVSTKEHELSLSSRSSTPYSVYSIHRFDLRNFLLKFVPSHVIRALFLCAVDTPLLVAGLQDVDIDRVEQTVRLLSAELPAGGPERRALMGEDSPALFLSQPHKFLLLPGYRIGLRLAAEELTKQILEHTTSQNSMIVNNNAN